MRDVHPKERKPRATGQLPEERALLERIISHGLVDVGRALDPDNDQLFTWWAPWREMRQRNIGWRLDYVLASQSLYATRPPLEAQREFGTSDHAPVLAEFESLSGVQALGLGARKSTGLEPIRPSSAPSRLTAEPPSRRPALTTHLLSTK